MSLTLEAGREPGLRLAEASASARSSTLTASTQRKSAASASATSIAISARLQGVSAQGQRLLEQRARRLPARRRLGAGGLAQEPDAAPWRGRLVERAGEERGGRLWRAAVDRRQGRLAQAVHHPRVSGGPHPHQVGGDPAGRRPLEVQQAGRRAVRGVAPVPSE